MVRTSSGVWRSPVLVVVAVFAVLMSGCGGSGEATSSKSGSADNVDVDLSELKTATTEHKLPDAPKDKHRHAKTDGEVLHPTETLPVFDAVDGDPIAKLPKKQLKSPTWVPVIDKKDDWAHILLPTRPNDSSGWIHTTKDNVESAHNDYRAEVDLSDFSITTFHKGEQTHEYEVGIGKEKHPTPTGRAYIIASVDEQEDDYSPVILPLSVHSNNLTTYGGGPGTVGIHTWPDNSFLGEENSDGCVRVTSSALDQLVKLPLGTVVDIVD